MTILDRKEADFSFDIDVAIVGAGSCGLCAALAAHEAGASVLVLEADAQPMGTTAMSTGLIPAANSRFQRDAGIEDSAEQFAADIMGKADGEPDANVVATLAAESARTVEWLADKHQVPLSLVDSFLYPGHAAKRMHGTPNRTGAELMGALVGAVERAGIDVLTEARVINLFADSNGRVCGLRCQRPDGAVEDLECRAMVLACCGFAGNPELVSKYIP
ncbi:MAG: FAD-dependent oxidoreductase, partial [Woeseiaceae bacterium]